MTDATRALPPCASDTNGEGRDDNPADRRPLHLGAGRERFGWLWLSYPILLMVAFTAWAWSSPAGASPDEDYHLISSWCALGTRPGLCEPGSDSLSRVVPVDLVTVACYAFHRNHDGDCPRQPGVMIETTRGNFNREYPGGFYTVMGVLASTSIGVSAVAMRLLNGAIYVVGLGLLLAFVKPGRRSNYQLASLASLVPLGTFIVPAVNPSSWAVTSATLLWASAVELPRATQRSRIIGLSSVAILALALAFAGRADATAYAAVALALAWLGNAARTRRSIVQAAVAFVLVGASYLWYRSLGQSRIFTLPVSTGARVTWLDIVENLPDLWAGSFGSRSLGWLDTPMPQITRVGAGAVFVAVLLWGLRRSSWRKVIALLVVTSLAITIPMLVLTSTNLAVGQLVQPRYLLPLLVMIIMIALAEENPDGPQLNRTQSAVIVASVTIAFAGALHTNLRRYVTGIGANSWLNLDSQISWWWPYGPSPMTVFVVGTLAFLGAATAVFATQPHSLLALARTKA